MDYLIGHLVGDFLLQNDWQAMHKKEDSFRGLVSCLVHCILYTLAVCLFTGWWRLDLIGLVFLSHFPIDKTYIVAWYMIKTESFRRLLSVEPLVVPPEYTWTLADLYLRIKNAEDNHKIWAYLFVDNTVHLTLLWLIARYAV